MIDNFYNYLTERNARVKQEAEERFKTPEYKSKWIKDGYAIETSEPVDLWVRSFIIHLYERNNLAESEIDISPTLRKPPKIVQYRIRELDPRTDYNAYNEESSTKGTVMEAKAFTPEEMLMIAAHFRRRGFYAGIAFSGAVVVANKARKRFGIKVVRKNPNKN